MCAASYVLGPEIFFSGFFDEKKLKKNSVYSKYKCCDTIYTTIQNMGSGFFFKYLIHLFSKDVLN